MLYRMEERGAAVNRILSDFFANQPDGKAILFHESIDEVMSLFTMLQQAGFSVVAEHSQFSDAMRTESLRLFRNGTARVIVSARSLIEGFNVPSADIGIVVAASASVRQRIQTLGRLLRRSVRADGTQKEATLHVLYAADTVDELIYEKADWEHFTGAKVNEYYAWTGAGTSEPEPRAEPPRRPRPIDAAIDISKLNPGDVYPGDPDQGKIFTIDTQGTMRAETGELLLPHDQLQAILGSYYRTTGRFRITPIKHLVLKLEKTREGWRSIYLGKLDDSPVAVGDNAATDMREYSAGDLYPLSKVKGRTFSVLQRDKRLIARKTASGVQFVVPFDAILDEPKTKRLREIQERLAAAYLRGHRMSKITVTAEGHVVYVVNNEGHFVGTAPEGSDGFEFESPSANKEEHR
ncbi:MAG TPA: hypothetical protein DCQ33_01915 [Nitrospira sp.]|nr:hypothetical protein [Nitrospira sp.]